MTRVASSLASNPIAPVATVYNDPAWAKLVCACYGFEDRSIVVGAARLPLFLTTSPLLGRKLTSNVFNFYASPIYETEEECAELVSRAVALAEAEQVDYLEIRSLHVLPAAIAERGGLHRREQSYATLVPVGAYATSVEAETDARRWLREPYRHMAARDLRLATAASLEDLEAFYDLLVRRNRDRHAMIAQPWALFEGLYEDWLAQDRGALWLVRDGDALVAGLLCLRANDAVTAIFATSAAGYDVCAPQAVLKHEALMHYAQAGCASFDLGATAASDEGLRFSKERFGGRTFRMPYYYRLVRALEIPSADYAQAYPWLRAPYRYVPVVVAKWLASRIVRYLN